MHFFISTHLQVNPSILHLWLIMINHSPWLWLMRFIFLSDWQHLFKHTLNDYDITNRLSKIWVCSLIFCKIIFGDFISVDTEDLPEVNEMVCDILLWHLSVVEKKQLRDYTRHKMFIHVYFVLKLVVKRKGGSRSLVTRFVCIFNVSYQK